MVESLQVIALISGGKDSFYSLLHCVQNGHRVVALGNLYPSPPAIQETGVDEENVEEHDLNSFMYQTVGHTVIPLYEQALGIPLYRQEILGTAVQTSLSYGQDTVDGVVDDGQEDETESLVPLLKRIMAAHPEANALSTGAILSTYQRTRIESIAIRLGLTPLAYLWQYPNLSPATQSSLLSDMAAVGLDARIVKVASGGLDESFLWQNVADPAVVSRLERVMKRFGVDGDGAVLGEGGEFETLVLDGPSSVFKGKLVVEESDRSVVPEGGGAAWIKVRKARVVMKEDGGTEGWSCKVPDLLETRFKDLLHFLDSVDTIVTPPELEHLYLKSSTAMDLPIIGANIDLHDDILHWTVQEVPEPSDTISMEAEKLIARVRRLLQKSSLTSTSIISTTIILRSMDDFGTINKIYSTIFPRPNPPSRVTISCGDCMPPKTNIIIHLRVHNPIKGEVISLKKKALHVQSQSYWAPANIGSYSQAISIPGVAVAADRSNNNDCNKDDEGYEEGSCDDNIFWTSSIAGQIPLIPHTMALPPALAANALQSPNQPADMLDEFREHLALSFQHMCRIAAEIDVKWFTHCVAYVPSSTSTLSTSPNQRALLANTAWSELHRQTFHALDTHNETSEVKEENADSRDLWEERYMSSSHQHGAVEQEKRVPDWSVIDQTFATGKRGHNPPFWTAEVDALPRGACVEIAAGLGLTGSFVTIQKVMPTRKEFNIYRTSTSNRLYIVIEIGYMTQLSDIRLQLSAVLTLLAPSADFNLDSIADAEVKTESALKWMMTNNTACWLDASIDGLWDWANGIGCKGGVPCRSIWYGMDTRFSGVWIFENVV